MTEHPVLKAISEALREGTLTEPFSCEDVERTCCLPGESLSRGFFDEHAVGNSAGNPELFECVAPGLYRRTHLADYGV
jgi:hypothetical protein